MDKWMQEQVSVGGMTGTRAEYVQHLVDFNGLTLKEAIAAACYAKKVA